MSLININSETIELYTKQLRMPTFNRYEDVIRQLDSDKGYEEFLLELLKMEVASRLENNQKRKIKAAKFPYIKTIDELDMGRFQHIDEAFINQLASCDFINKRQNLVMIGNTGNGNYRKLLLIERFPKVLSNNAFVILKIFR